MDETFNEPTDIDTHVGGRDAEPIRERRLGIFLYMEHEPWY